MSSRAIFTEGERVEYAAHPVAAVDDREHDDRAMLERESSPADLFVAVDGEDWRPATVLGVEDVPGQAGIVEGSEVVHLEPDDGAPPLHLNAKLVRATLRRGR